MKATPATAEKTAAPPAAEAPPSKEKAAAPPPSNAGTPTGEKTATGKDIYAGPRGGKYHYSASGKKVYERKKK